MARLGPFEDRPRIAVAVSGGGDSMSLLHLMQEWAVDQGGEAIAMTVNHGLRPEAADESRKVADWCEKLGCAHVALIWTHSVPVSAGLQEQARQARYRLLDEACRERNILHLAVAHHRDDQAETILLRLGQGSGVDGLAGMAPIVELPHVRLIRPVLCHTGKALKATCTARRQDWIEDPSNLSMRFARARLRGGRDILAKHGLDAISLEQTALRMAQVRQMLEQEVAGFLARYGAVPSDGVFTLDIAAFRNRPLEMRQRILGELARAVGGLSYLPRFVKLKTACDTIMQPCFKRTTLGHCLIARNRNLLRIQRESRSLKADGDHPAAKAIFAIV